MPEDLPQAAGKIRQDNNLLERPSDSLGPQRQRDHLLVEACHLLVDSRCLRDLFEGLAQPILSLTSCDFLKFSVHDPSQNCMITHYWKGSGESVQFDAFAVDECVSGWVWTHQESVTISDVETEMRFPACLQQLRKHGVRSYVMLPLSFGQRRFGAIGLGTCIPEATDPEELKFFHEVAFLVGVAIENQMARRLEEERRTRLEGVLSVGQELSTSPEPNHLLPMVLANLRRFLSYDYAAVALLDDNKNHIQVHATEQRPGLEALLWEGRRGLTSESTARQAMQTRSITIRTADDLQRMESTGAIPLREAGIQSLCNVPIYSGEQVFGSIHLGSLRPHAFRQEDADYLQQMANQVAAALRNAKAYREVAQLKDRFAIEKRYLESEIRTEMRGDEIVGSSQSLKRVLDYASIVAVTDSTVLITGETGTGKERLARSIHGMSRRKDQTFIKLNCAAIPTGLLESELFGHEKGAFTGAVSQKIGRLELADKGTLFLDEIGEIPLELQPKLLRVLQDQEFERLGGIRTIRVDARLIAATNRDLARAVEDKLFRSDLFYRLHVFPLHLPALRDRREDIPMLVRHFVQKSSARLGRHIESISRETMDALLQWNWPGNVRELENFIERSAILSDGPVLRAPLAELRQEIARQRTGTEATLKDREREQIIDVLRQTRGVLSGPRGAAARLGVQRTTLQYKLQKLGISRKDYLD